MTTTPDREFQVSGDYEYRPWPEMRHAAASLRRLAKNHPPGSAFTGAAAVLMTAFSVEGFMQTVGAEATGDRWLSGKRPVERMPVLDKLICICEASGVTIDYDEEPWRSIKQLFRARDTLAHPKPTTRVASGKITAPLDADPRDLFYTVLDREYQPLHDMDALESVAARIDEALLRVWVALGKTQAAFTMHGGGTWSVSIGSD